MFCIINNLVIEQNVYIKEKLNYFTCNLSKSNFWINRICESIVCQCHIIRRSGRFKGIFTTGIQDGNGLVRRVLLTLFVICYLLVQYNLIQEMFARFCNLCHRTGYAEFTQLQRCYVSATLCFPVVYFVMRTNVYIKLISCTEKKFQKER